MANEQKGYAKVKRDMHIGYRKMKRWYSRKFKYRVPIVKSSSNSSSSSADSWYEGDGTNQEVAQNAYKPWVDVSEPISPKSTGNMVTQLAQKMGVNATDYAEVWMSERDLPMHTQVSVDDQTLYIVSKSDYSAYVGVYYYGLNGDDQHNA